MLSSVHCLALSLARYLLPATVGRSHTKRERIEFEKKSNHRQAYTLALFASPKSLAWRELLVVVVVTGALAVSNISARAFIDEGM